MCVEKNNKSEKTINNIFIYFVTYSTFETIFILSVLCASNLYKIINRIITPSKFWQYLITALYCCIHICFMLFINFNIRYILKYFF